MELGLTAEFQVGNTGAKFSPHGHKMLLSVDLRYQTNDIRRKF